MKTIFVSIASYCDPELPYTIQNALDNASSVERLRIGVVEQHTEEARLRFDEHAAPYIRYLRVDPAHSRGACWARSVAMTLYEGEDWFFQIDSHMMFEKDWDKYFIEQWHECRKQSKKPLISSYPHAYELKDGKRIKLKATEGALVHVVPETHSFEEGHLALAFNAVPFDTTKPVRGFHIGAGCLFAPGNFVSEVPYDPYAYFTGEEQALALRAFTRGWDIFHTPNLPVYHLYDTGNGSVTRPKHWDETADKERQVRWWERDKQAKTRFQKLVDSHPMGIYGAGRRRSVADYAEFCGIDYKTKTLTKTARVGPWATEE